jgi:hypothetical protein
MEKDITKIDAPKKKEYNFELPDMVILILPQKKRLSNYVNGVENRYQKISHRLKNIMMVFVKKMGIKKPMPEILDHIDSEERWGLLKEDNEYQRFIS